MKTCSVVSHRLWLKGGCNPGNGAQNWCVPGASVRLWTSCAACLVNSNLRRLTLQEHNKGKIARRYSDSDVGQHFIWSTKLAAKVQNGRVMDCQFHAAVRCHLQDLRGEPFAEKGILQAPKVPAQVHAQHEIACGVENLLQTFHASLSPFNFTVRKKLKEKWTDSMFGR